MPAIQNSTNCVRSPQLIALPITSALLCLRQLERLLTLNDVQLYCADRLIRVSAALTTLHLLTMADDAKPLGEEQKRKCEEELNIIIKEASELGLVETSKLAGTILGETKHENAGTIFERLHQLEELFQMQVDAVHFFHVDKARFRYYNNSELAGSVFKDRFPLANVELVEAGNCIALDRYTACVCHLMRALDIVLTELESRLGITAPDRGPERTWGKTLERIRIKISANDKAPPPNWKTDRDFYDKAQAFIQAVKMPYRDKTFHVSAAYDEQGAISMFNVVVEALRHCGMR